MLPSRCREGALISSKNRSNPSAGSPGQEEVFPHVSYAILPLGTFYLLASQGYSQSNCFSPTKEPFTCWKRILIAMSFPETKNVWFLHCAPSGYLGALL